jgi:hypothetical protein
VTRSTIKNNRGNGKRADLPVTRETLDAGTRQSRKRKTRAERLTELLRGVNLVRGELKDFWQVYRLVYDQANREGPRPAAGRPGKRVLIPPAITIEDALKRALEVCLDGQQDLREYIEKRSVDEDRPPGEPWYWYVFIRDARERLRALIQGLPDSAVMVDAEGIFRERRDTFAEAIDGVKEDYLRRCALEDCQRIFLAKKPNQQYHDPKCANVVKNRRFRREQKERLDIYLRDENLRRVRQNKRAKTARER